MPPLQDALYDLSHDPGELANLIAREPARAGELRALIDMQLARYGRAE
jgi:hypothetical protein